VGKMLAFSLDIPVCGVSTLESLAYHARHENGRICAVIHAGIGSSVYAAFYIPTGEDIAMDGDYYYGDIKDLLADMSKPTVLVGQGTESYTKGRDSSSVLIKAVEAAADGAVIALLAARRLARGESDDTLALTPLYLKESTAKALTNKYRNIRTED
jgi:tRNA threonylcarbamoyladenosine biosynthesis protein TsaB